MSGRSRSPSATSSTSDDVQVARPDSTRARRKSVPMSRLDRLELTERHASRRRVRPDVRRPHGRRRTWTRRAAISVEREEAASVAPSCHPAAFARCRGRVGRPAPEVAADPDARAPVSRSASGVGSACGAGGCAASSSPADRAARHLHDVRRRRAVDQLMSSALSLVDPSSARSPARVARRTNVPRSHGGSRRPSRSFRHLTASRGEVRAGGRGGARR